MNSILSALSMNSSFDIVPSPSWSMVRIIACTHNVRTLYPPPDVCHLDAGLDALLAHVPGLGELQETQHKLVDLLHVDAASTVLVKHVKYPTKCNNMKGHYEREIFLTRS